MIKLTRTILFSLFIAAVVTEASMYGQREREVPPPPGDEEYGPQFFDQLRRMAERFRDANLHRVFQVARPIQCSELATESEWRHVAFFSESRKLGDWYRTSLVEVKNDPAAYISKGVCRSQRAPVKVTTRFPVYESVETERGEGIHSREVQVKVNTPANVNFNLESRAYTFELPYLFKGRDENGDSVYTFNPRRLSDRYVTNVTSLWQCKAVDAEYVTYQFLICYTRLAGQDLDIKLDSRDKSTISFGASGYSILSNGRALTDR